MIGVKIGLPAAVFGWSVAATATGLVRTVSRFSWARFGLGLCEGANFPAAIKIVSEWFPARERALATGLFNCGTNIGAVICPYAVVWLVQRGDWPMAFYATGGLGLIWIICWSRIYQSPRKHPDVDPTELAWIEGDGRPKNDGAAGEANEPSQVHLRWWSLFRYRFVWGYIIASVLCGPVWWIYLSWVPDFLNLRFHLTLAESALPVMVIYQMTAFGGIGAGWFSSRLIARGWSVNGARKLALLICALCVLPVCIAGFTSHLWVAVILVGLAASAHQGWSANLYSAISDVMPKSVVSTIVGVGAAAAGFATMGAAHAVGFVLDTTHSFAALFCIASTPYLISLGILHLLVPRFGGRPSPTAPLPPA